MVSLTNEQLFKALAREINYTKTEDMNLREDERVFHREQEILNDLQHRGFSMEAIKEIRRQYE